MKKSKRMLALVLSLSLVNPLVVPSAHAGLVTTEEVVREAAVEQAESGRARLAAALSRADVRAALEKKGVAPEAALARVAALSDEEAGQLAEQIDKAPAGGIIEVILLVFFVLLLTDILGLTKVFPFTRSVR